MSRKDTAFETATAMFDMRGKSGSEQVFNTGFRKGCTPAEYKILESIHGRECVRVLEMTGHALELDGFDEDGKKQFRARTNDEELDRLRVWYGPAAVERVFKDEYPEFPVTFAQARIPVKIPDNVTKISGREKPQEQKNKIADAMKGGQNGQGGNEG